MKTRLALTLLTVALGWAAPAASPQPAYPVVTPGQEFRFPHDHGAHPAYRTEWWYFTGWLAGPDGRPIGFQITFFRSRPEIDPANASVFATLICEAALPFTQHNTASVALAPNGDFIINDTLNPAPDECASPVLLIRSSGSGVWFAAGIPNLGGN